MHGDTLQHRVRIRNPQGFHMRPITAFAEMARRYQSTVTVTKEDRKVDGKSPLELLFLAAPQGAELVLETSGPDAREALAALVELLETITFDEGDASPLPQTR